MPIVAGPGAVEPLVPQGTVSPLDEDVQPAHAAGGRGRVGCNHTVNRSSQRLPALPGTITATIAPLVPQGEVGPHHEDVDAVVAPGDGRRAIDDDPVHRTP